ncbi:hypothetical protein CsatA_026189 [Cannabis sativa]
MLWRNLRIRPILSKTSLNSLDFLSEISLSTLPVVVFETVLFIVSFCFLTMADNKTITSPTQYDVINGTCVWISVFVVSCTVPSVEPWMVFLSSGVQLLVRHL